MLHHNFGSPQPWFLGMEGANLTIHESSPGSLWLRLSFPVGSLRGKLETVRAKDAKSKPLFLCSAADGAGPEHRLPSSDILG